MHGVPSSRADRLAAWRSRIDPLMLAAALLFLAAYSVGVLAEPQGAPRLLVNGVLAATWLLFGVDFAVSLGLADRRRRWLLRHLPDLATLVLPFLRPLQLLRLVTLLRIVHSSSGALLRGRTSVYVAGAALLLVYTGALAVLDVERDAPGATITSFGDALWWAVVTITTVGYGDFTPVTVLGRCIAVALMLSGIAVIGVVTASVASWFVQQAQGARGERQQELQAQLKALTEEVRALREQMPR